MRLSTESAPLAARAGRGWLPLAGLLLCIALGDCLVTDEKCDENQLLTSGNLNVCVCVPGTVRDPRGYGCSKCGANENAVSGVCECKPGFERKTKTAACMVSSGGVLGAACDEATPCAEPYAYCAASGGEQFCTTSGCTTQDACPSAWRCDRSQAKAFCARPPIGLERACARAEDCAASEATFCDTFFTNKCYVEKCVTGENACPSEYVCCDLAAIVHTSVCVPTKMLADNACPDGNAPVSP
jgi:hypothetical protein